MTRTAEPTIVRGRTRPAFPERAVITGGMPYGNKDLHFGHIGGVFVHADAFARFLRDRIGKENVLFVSGTDGFGSPIVEYHRRLQESGEFTGSLAEFVEANHERQRDALSLYDVDLSLFAASSFEPYVGIHREIGAWILETLHAHGTLVRRVTPQFYDAEHGTFLNGRQVLGGCPVQGCNAESAYADECSLGHQYEPKDLLKPKSTLSGTEPEMRDVTNWYLDLPRFRAELAGWIDELRRKPACRQFVASNMAEYLEPPMIHLTKDQVGAFEELVSSLPAHERGAGRGKSIHLTFASLDALEEARALLAEHSIRYRTGKTLVPFRLTGNLDWGLEAPELEGLGGLTFWVWPESLWAPISFTAACLEARGEDRSSWKDWWCSRDTAIYQFIGEDNIFFYGVAQSGIWLGLQEGKPSTDAPEGELQFTQLVANRHIMFMDKKASSSGKVKPPLAREILEHYTSDQLRTHFFSLGLGMRSVGFPQKPLNPTAGEKDADPVLKEGNLLSNTLNSAVRSCFYTTQKQLGGRLPVGEVSRAVIELSEEALLDYEEAMFRHEFHRTVVIAGDYIRAINAHWNDHKPYRDDCDEGVRVQALVDTFHMVRVAALLMHPIAPRGTEMIREYLGVSEEFWSWERAFDPLYAFLDDPMTHELKVLEQRVDFFPKHESQYKS